MAQRKATYLPEEYLDFERAAELRHEYIDGEVCEMAGESLAHRQICVNIAAELRQLLKGPRCQALSPNMKVRAKNRGMFAYPDLSIVCGEPVFHDSQKDVLVNPKVITEVFSPSTKRYDQTKKFFRYRKEIPSLMDYVLIYQDSQFIEHHEKASDGRWVHIAFDGIDDIFRIPSIECEIPLTEIYDRVDFAVIPNDDAGFSGLSTQ
ncbi:MAG: Uma2 family endonuclease [Blastocatellia bacterium]